MKLCVLLLCVFFHLISSESEVVSFGDDLLLSTEDEASLSSSDLAVVRDNKDTGSYLFKIENDIEKASGISLNIKIQDLMTSSSSYVRISPTFVGCLQKVMTYIHNRHGLKLVIDSGYKTNTEIGGSTDVVDVYAAAGTGAVLSIDGTGDILKIAEAATKFCPSILASGRGFLGIVMRSQTVHLHMTGSADSGAYFGVDGYTGKPLAEFQAWAEEQVNTALDPVGSLNCSKFTSLADGEVYPTSAATPEDAVGSADSDINEEDDYLSRLVVYPGTNLSPSGKKQMSPRMFEVIRKLQLLTRNTFTGSELHVVKLFAAVANSLHLEGRMAELQLSDDTTSASMVTLSNLALCAGASYVKHNGDRILVAVKKQSSIDIQKVKFQQGELVKVSPPEHLSSKLVLPEYLVDDAEKYPIFDTEPQTGKQISEFTTLGQYTSPSTRYLRLHPAMVQCYDNIIRHEKKWNNGVPVPITLERAHLTLDELDPLFDPESDPRGFAHVLGQALYLQYGPGFTAEGFSQSAGIVYDQHRLVRIAIQLCGPLFYNIDKYERYGLGIGVYEGGVYIDFRSDFMLWFDDFDLLPEGVEFGDYNDEMEERLQNAIDGRIVSPEEPVKVCLKDHVPKPQSKDFVYTHQVHIQERRRKRQAGTEDEQACVVQTDTEFCAVSKKHRDIVVDHLWELMKRKHLWSEQFEADLNAALTECFGACGTCLLGQVYEDKTEHCSNFLHRAPFVLMNDIPDVTNFYSLPNFFVREQACSSGRHCVDSSPLYAIVAASANALFRATTTTSIDQELYGKVDNPLPVIEIVYDIYAISAIGTVTAWVTDEKEATYLRAPLKTAMLYNKQVTNVVVKVVQEASIDAVNSVMESMVADWVREGCPLNTREYVAPYTVELVTAGTIVKRDTRTAEGFKFGDKLLLERKHFEHYWFNRVK